MRFSSLLAAAGLLHTAAFAFYIYIPEGWDTPAVKSLLDNARHNGGRSPSVERPRALTLPLHRLASSQLERRENRYEILRAANPSQKDSVAIDQDQFDLTYFTTVSFGSGKEEYNMLLDTAASNTWVMSSKCTTQICRTHNTFGREDSSTLQETSETFSITYGTGNVNGTISRDDVHFAGFTVPLEFGLADGISNEFASYALDGILGFGKGGGSSSQTRAPSLIDVLSERSLIDTKIFGVHLGRNTNPPIDGELNLGAPNPSRYDGDLQYTSVIANDRGFWEIPIDGVGVDGKMAGVSGRSAILDTGTSFILVPPDDASKLHASISGATREGETYKVPCDTTANLEISFSGIVYRIPPVDWVGGDKSKVTCDSRIIARQAFGASQWLVGDVFLKNVYTLYDYDQSRVGFGTKGQSADTPATPTEIGQSPTSAVDGAPSLGPSSSPTSDPESSTVLTQPAPGPSSQIGSSPLGPVASSPAEQQAVGAGPSAGTSTSSASAPTSATANGGMLALGIAIGGLIAFA